RKFLCIFQKLFEIAIYFLIGKIDSSSHFWIFNIKLALIFTIGFYRRNIIYFKSKRATQIYPVIHGIGKFQSQKTFRLGLGLILASCEDKKNRNYSDYFPHNLVNFTCLIRLSSTTSTVNK